MNMELKVHVFQVPDGRLPMYTSGDEKIYAPALIELEAEDPVSMRDKIIAMVENVAKEWVKPEGDEVAHELYIAHTDMFGRSGTTKHMTKLAVLLAPPDLTFHTVENPKK